MYFRVEKEIYIMICLYFIRVYRMSHKYVLKFYECVPGIGTMFL